MKASDTAIVKEYVSELNPADLEKLSICFATNHPADVAEILSGNKSIEAVLDSAKNFEETFAILDFIGSIVKSEQIKRANQKKVV